ncbi:hypothetical protein BCR39DRAFT_172820 [Naematelia encephala]|uniref:Uncharacterized protein n=1 Tax=Naematelia encephala TaxID=71784 RepID=A0A1Y2B495_9TREE|nr:hypothetical protein BCR39DRAFT_172820 [Naematelia encephala]
MRSADLPPETESRMRHLLSQNKILSYPSGHRNFTRPDPEHHASSIIPNSITQGSQIDHRTIDQRNLTRQIIPQDSDFAQQRSHDNSSHTDAVFESPPSASSRNESFDPNPTSRFESNSRPTSYAFGNEAYQAFLFQHAESLPPSSSRLAPSFEHFPAPETDKLPLQQSLYRIQADNASSLPLIAPLSVFASAPATNESWVQQSSSQRNDAVTSGNDTSRSYIGKPYEYSIAHALISPETSESNRSVSGPVSMHRESQQDHQTPRTLPGVSTFQLPVDNPRAQSFKIFPGPDSSNEPITDPSSTGGRSLNPLSASAASIPVARKRKRIQENDGPPRAGSSISRSNLPRDVSLSPLRMGASQFSVVITALDGTSFRMHCINFTRTDAKFMTLKFCDSCGQPTKALPMVVNNKWRSKGPMVRAWCCGSYSCFINCQKTILRRYYFKQVEANRHIYGNCGECGATTHPNKRLFGGGNATMRLPTDSASIWYCSIICRDNQMQAAASFAGSTSTGEASSSG